MVSTFQGYQFPITSGQDLLTILGTYRFFALLPEPGISIPPEVGLLTGLAGEEIQPTNVFLGIMMETERQTLPSTELAQAPGYNSSFAKRPCPT